MNEQCNPKLTNNAQRLRREMTKEERHLWYDFLKNLQVPVKRQKIFGQYIVDFYYAGAKLVIEIDGSQHYEETAAAVDKVRDEYLESLGLKVMRYSNADINQRFENVCNDIYNMIFPTGD
ncbi:MAG: endonuclease domain-containing protein [Burkholderiales bacterium]